MRSSRRRVRSGFTLLEVLLVIAILGVIAVMVVPQLLGRQQESYIGATRASIKGVEEALKLYAFDHDGNYPEGNRDFLPQLLDRQDYNGKQVGPYLTEEPNDAWGEPFYYEYPNNKGGNSNKPAIWSSGPNRQNEDGGGDDITNWSQN